MTDAELLAALKNPATVRAYSFEILRAIARRVNSAASINAGREFVIRALAVRKFFGEQNEVVLNSLVRGVGLFPYLDASSPMALEDQIALEAHRADDLNDGTVFHTLQLQIHAQIMAGRNVVLSARTSVGKSKVVDAIVASRRFKKIAIIVPTIALIDETRRRLTKQFGATHSIITHPTQAPVEGLLPIYVLTQERALVRTDLQDIDFFIIDEFYKLDLRREDQSRAVDLNLCFRKLVKTGAQFYLIGPNIAGIEGLSIYKPHFIPSEFATVAVDVESYELSRAGDERANKLIELLSALKTPTLVYCQAPPSASRVANLLVDRSLYPPTAATKEICEWIDANYHPDWVLRRALYHGVGIHHGNIPRSVQQYMMRAFDAGSIKTLVCTSTIIEGVNTAAENIILYDRRLNRDTIDSFTFRNISGRAGRMRKYFVGKVFVLEQPPTETPYTVEIPLERQDESTPLSLLLDLDDLDLEQISRERVRAAVVESTLSEATVRANRHFSVESQRKVANAIRRDPDGYIAKLSWTGFPQASQLTTVCNLIADHLDNQTLIRGGVVNGAHLAAQLGSLNRYETFREFFDNRVAYKPEGMSTSDAIEQGLYFLRRYCGFSFPRQLLAIENIQRDVFRQLGYESRADYSLYASQVENLFMKPAVFSLEEYGLPLELGRRLERRFGEITKLDEALAIARSLNPRQLDLHEFERVMLLDLQESLRPKPSVSRV